MRLAFTILLSVMTVIPGVTSAQPLPKNVSDLLQRYRISTSTVSLEIRDIASNRRLVDVNSKVERNPASVIKLLTTLAALDILGPSYTWETDYLADGEVRNGVLKGNMVVRGGGDPFITADNFWHQVWSVRQRGIDTISGDIVIDNTLFDIPHQDRGSFDGKPWRLYNVGPDAALVNLSATRFGIQPFGGEIQIFADPPLAGLIIENNIKPGNGKCTSRKSGWRYGTLEKNGTLVARFDGTYSTDCGEHSFSRALVSNEEYTYRLFRNYWELSGGKFYGELQVDKTPEDAVPILTYQSRPLADIITSINKFSNNVMARNLLLTLDAQDEGRAATLDGAQGWIAYWLRANGVSVPGLRLDNGSGLSRTSRITAYGLSELLQYGWRSNYQPEFLSSLPLVALDGTMRKRLQDSPLQGRARIKTGLINGVRSMAGYVNSGSGKVYSVVMLIESNQVNYFNGNRIQDAVLEWIYDL
jgi:D-alanyl-D-alanine carboxypeptidase/D-alanyl-D-alanine-endopeptidase (penicillin-binding protein 4)